MIVSWHSLVLDEAITERHSTRMFLPQSVPRALVDESLALAQHAPSNSNIQPWHMVFASGPPRDRLVAALLDAARRRPPNIPPLPESFQHYRRELGAQVYGAMGESPPRTRRSMQPLWSGRTYQNSSRGWAIGPMAR